MSSLKTQTDDKDLLQFKKAVPTRAEAISFSVYRLSTHRVVSSKERSTKFAMLFGFIIFFFKK